MWGASPWPAICCWPGICLLILDIISVVGWMESDAAFRTLFDGSSFDKKAGRFKCLEMRN